MPLLVLLDQKRTECHPTAIPSIKAYWIWSPTGCLVEVDVDSLELEIRVAVIGASRVDAVLVRDHLPELHTFATLSHT